MSGGESIAIGFNYQKEDQQAWRELTRRVFDRLTEAGLKPDGPEDDAQLAQNPQSIIFIHRQDNGRLNAYALVRDESEPFLHVTRIQIACKNRDNLFDEKCDQTLTGFMKPRMASANASVYPGPGRLMSILGLS